MTVPIELATDVLVLGGGPAGAWAAIEAAERGASVVLADKGRIGTSGATAAANTAVIDVAPASVGRQRVIDRRLTRGLDLASGSWIESVVDETHGRLTTLQSWGYVFPRDDKGEPYRGTLRGPDYMQLLRRRLNKLRVRLFDQSPALELLMHEGAVAGASGVDRRDATPWTVRAGAVVIATGGCAFMSKALGTYGLTGDGLLMGAEAGAPLSGLEFSGQYGIAHVAATVTKNLIYDWATFSDGDGRELVGHDNFALLAQHLPQGPVFAIIDKASPDIQEGLRRGQPNIFLALDRQGIDPFRQRFPVTLIYEGTVRGVGGLVVDERGATSVPGLYAAGDAASREPLVGAASGGGGPNSTWAIASGVWAGGSAAAFATQLGSHLHGRSARAVGQVGLSSGHDIGQVGDWISSIQSEVFPLDSSFSRDASTLDRGSKRLDAVWHEIASPNRRPSHATADYRVREVAAMTATARWVSAAALARPETRGIHRRRDHGAFDPAQSYRLRIRGVDEVKVETMAVGG